MSSDNILNHYKKLDNFYNNKIYIVLDKFGSKLEEIFGDELSAIEYLKKTINLFLNYNQEDIKAIKNGSDEYDDDMENAVNYAANFEILTIFGVDINKKIYKNIDGNCNIRDQHNIITNDLKLWQKWNRTEDEPNDFYYFVYTKHE